MGRFNANARLNRLEKGLSDHSTIAVAEDGQQIRIKRDDMLPLTTAAFRRRYAEIEGQPIPESRFDAKLDFIKRFAVRCTAPLVEVISGVLR
jgi:hypothetical protein